MSDRRAGCKLIRNFPNEPQAVQYILSILSNCVRAMKSSLRSDPVPKRLVLFVVEWDETMAIVSFKVDQFLVLQPPLLGFFHVDKFFMRLARFLTACPSELEFVQ